MIEAHELSRIVFGCGNIGGLGSSPVFRDKGDDPARALALLDEARRIGLTRFDTANTYGGGASETILGEWLARQGDAYRASVEIATKVGNPFGCPADDRPLSRRQIDHHLGQSLRRLGVDRVSLYYLHEFDPLTPLTETLEALDRALASGKIAAFGVSNATARDLDAVISLTSGALRTSFTHVQNGFNAVQTGDLDDVIPLAAREGLKYVAFSPLAGGLLTGKYAEGRAPPPGTRVGAMPEAYAELLNPATFAAIDELRRRAAARGWSLPRAALRYVLDTPGVDSLIVAPRSLEQFAGYAIDLPQPGGGAPGNA